MQSIVIMPIIITIGLLVGGNEYIRYQCSNYEIVTGKETRYVNYDACYIKSAQGFERWDEYKGRSIASEGLTRK